jgi:hypothetical protein
LGIKLIWLMVSILKQLSRELLKFIVGSVL